MLKQVRSLLLVLIALSVVLSLPTAGQAAEPKKGGAIIEAMGTEPTTLDCFKARRRPEIMILHMIHEPLFTTTPELKVEPLLVDTFEVSDDAKVWTLVLKEGITFHDGEPLNAEAVKFSLEKHMKGSQAGKLKIIDSIDVVDDKTVRLNLNKPYPELKNVLANYDCGMVSPKAFTEAGGDWGNKVIVGSGPMMLKEWRSGDRIIFSRNPDYKHGPSYLTNRGPAYVDEWHIRFLPEPATLIAELTSGDVDLSDYVTERDVKRVKNNKNTELIEAKGTSAIYIAINCGNEPYNDHRVRQALAQAVNAAAVRKAAMSGVGSALYTPIAPTIMGFNPEAAEAAKPLVKYDPENAKKLLDEAGWKDNGQGVREKDGKPLEANFLAFNIARYKRMGEVVTPMLESVGFKVDLKILEPGDLYERVLAKKHDLLSTGLVGSQGLALDDLVLTTHSDSLGSVMQWCYYKNDQVDQYLDTARYDADPAKRAEALKEVQKVVAADIPVIPIANALEIFGYKKSLGGVDNYTKHPWCFDQVDAYRSLEIWKP